jgi:predicted nucleotidyltransferase
MAELTVEEGNRLAQKFVDGVREKTGAVKMAALYGSFVRGDFNRQTSDINVLVVLGAVDMSALKTLAESVQAGKTGYRLAPLFLEEAELRRFAELFPVKFHEMKNHHRIIAGEDLLDPLSVEWSCFKDKLLQELLNIRMKLRRSYLLGSPHAELLKRALRTFIPHLLSIMRVLIALPESKKFDEDDRFFAVLNEKRLAVDSSSSAEIDEVYTLIFKNLDEIREAVERS